ncbi:Tellurite resistance protein, partial [Lacticaseibacillus paracasei subsp. paracasei Lpp123]
MRSFLKRVPLPMAGLTLGLASLGNLYKLAGWQLVGNLTGGLAALLFGLILLKICLTPLHAAKSLLDPIIASVSPTFFDDLDDLVHLFNCLGNAGGDRYCHLGISSDYPFWLKCIFFR